MNKKGISLIILIITIVVMLIIANTIIIFVNNQDLTKSSRLTLLQSDMQHMLDQYELIYNDLLIKCNGEIAKIDETELQDSIPNEYKSRYIATTDGIKYIGDDEEEKLIAEEMGIYTLTK